MLLADEVLLKTLKIVVNVERSTTNFSHSLPLTISLILIRLKTFLKSQGLIKLPKKYTLLRRHETSQKCTTQISNFYFCTYFLLFISFEEVAKNFNHFATNDFTFTNTTSLYSKPKYQHGCCITVPKNKKFTLTKYFLKTAEV